MYERINSSWINTANLSSLVDDHSLFGSSVSIRNDMAVIGAYAYGNCSRFLCPVLMEYSALRCIMLCCVSYMHRQ